MEMSFKNVLRIYRYLAIFLLVVLLISFILNGALLPIEITQLPNSGLYFFLAFRYFTRITTAFCSSPFSP